MKYVKRSFWSRYIDMDIEVFHLRPLMIVNFCCRRIPDILPPRPPKHFLLTIPTDISSFQIASLSADRHSPWASSLLYYYSYYVCF